MAIASSVISAATHVPVTAVRPAMIKCFPPLEATPSSANSAITSSTDVMSASPPPNVRIAQQDIISKLTTRAPSVIYSSPTAYFAPMEI